MAQQLRCCSYQNNVFKYYTHIQKESSVVEATRRLYWLLEYVLEYAYSNTYERVLEYSSTTQSYLLLLEYSVLRRILDKPGSLRLEGGRG